MTHPTTPFPLLRPLALALLLGAAAAGVSRGLAAAGARTAADLVGRPPPSERLLTAVVVFQLEDCTSNLAFLRLFDRPDVRRGIALDHLVIIGSAADSAAAADSLAARFGPVPLVRRSHRRLRPLRLLGFRRTPFLLVFDDRARVRLALESPETPEALVVLGFVLSALARDPSRNSNPTIAEPGS